MRSSDMVANQEPDDAIQTHLRKMQPPALCALVQAARAPDGRGQLGGRGAPTWGVGVARPDSAERVAQPLAQTRSGCVEAHVDPVQPRVGQQLAAGA